MDLSLRARSLMRRKAKMMRGAKRVEVSLGVRMKTIISTREKCRGRVE